VVGILGKKLGMTQIFAEDGELVAVTIIEAGPCWVLQKKEKATDGYESIQIGSDPLKEKRAVKARIGHCKKASAAPLRNMRELRGVSLDQWNVGDQFKADIFKPGDMVTISGVTKGKGFQGVVRRHGFRGGADTHGSMFHRAPGSIGASSYPSRVFKGMKMGGHMGQDRKTIKNIKVLRVDSVRNLLLVKGAVPGSPGGLLMIVNPQGEKSA
jgi:large subunit ribosomal protein L3